MVLEPFASAYGDQIVLQMSPQNWFAGAIRILEHRVEFDKDEKLREEGDKREDDVRREKTEMLKDMVNFMSYKTSDERPSQLDAWLIGLIKVACQ